MEALKVKLKTQVLCLLFKNGTQGKSVFCFMLLFKNGNQGKSEFINLSFFFWSHMAQTLSLVADKAVTCVATI